MKLIDLTRLALGNLRENPLRTFLCAMSVAIGTGALLIILGAGLFGQASIDEGLDTLGVSGLTVYLDDKGSGTPLSAETADKMEKTLTGISALMPIKAKAGDIRAGHSETSAMFLGADGRLGEVMKLEVLYGSLLTERENEASKRVAVIGDDLAKELFGRKNIVGRKVLLRIDGIDNYFTVCGVVKAQTGALGGAVSGFAPNLVYIPYSLVAGEKENADQVFVQCAGGTESSSVKREIEVYLNERVRVDGIVRVQNMSGMVETVKRLTNLCAVLFAAAGGVTLCVAVSGVMCSMLSAAYEKTGEIGIFLALGARPEDIRRLFLLQSVVLCAFGGVAGLTAAGLILHFTASLLLPGWKLTLGVFAVCVLSGAIAGIIPAVRASKLDPVDAMNK